MFTAKVEMMKGRKNVAAVATIHTNDGSYVESRVICEASNKTDATQKALDTLAAETAGDWAPVIIRFRGLVAMVWREPFTAYCYCISWEDEIGIRKNNGCTLGILSKERAVQSALNHLAQAAWDGVEAESPLLAECDSQVKSDFLSWVNFQKEHRAQQAKAA